MSATREAPVGGPDRPVVVDGAMGAVGEGGHAVALPTHHILGGPVRQHGAIGRSDDVQQLLLGLLETPPAAGQAHDGGGEPGRPPGQRDQDPVDDEAQLIGVCPIGQWGHASTGRQPRDPIGCGGGAGQGVGTAGGPAERREPVEAEVIGQRGGVHAPTGDRATRVAVRPADPGAVRGDDAGAHGLGGPVGASRVDSTTQPAVVPDHRGTVGSAVLGPREAAPANVWDRTSGGGAPPAVRPPAMGSGGAVAVVVLPAAATPGHDVEEQARGHEQPTEAVDTRDGRVGEGVEEGGPGQYEKADGTHEEGVEGEREAIAEQPHQEEREAW